ncbi:hypothetical protein [Anatilimnocola floriformis]|uniref:hypothetical protein n=1 Tax=Anatilimnocola floriformis TaxID=2948575 RepID=UPI0020C4EE28|nr:hypothetical protein [Anatilimnocola floriformis]
MRCLSVIAVSLILTATCVCTAEERTGLQNWGVIATASVEATGLPDLVTAELSQKNKVELVSRQDLEKIIQEQELAQAFGNAETKLRLKLSAMLKADALLMLAHEKREDRQFIRAVVCESKYGMRLRVEYWPADGKLEETLPQLVECVLSTQRDFAKGVRAVVAVPPFVSRNLTFEFDQYQSAFAALLQQGLMAREGVVAVELEEARSIRRELEIADEKRKAQLVALTIGGEFVMKAEKGAAPQGSLKVALSAAGEEERVLKKLNRPLPELITWLQQELPKEILAKLPEQQAKTQFTAAEQVKYLQARADQFAMLGQWEQVIGMREAAWLLAPDDFDLQLKVVTAQARWSRLPSSPADTQRRWMTLLELAERVIKSKKLSPREADFVVQLVNGPRSSSRDNAELLVRRLYPGFAQLDPKITDGMIRPLLWEGVEGKVLAGGKQTWSPDIQHAWWTGTALHIAAEAGTLRITEGAQPSVPPGSELPETEEDWERGMALWCWLFAEVFPQDKPVPEFFRMVFTDHGGSLHTRWRFPDERPEAAIAAMRRIEAAAGPTWGPFYRRVAEGLFRSEALSRHSFNRRALKPQPLPDYLRNFMHEPEKEQEYAAQIKQEFRELRQYVERLRDKVPTYYFPDAPAFQKGRSDFRYKLDDVSPFRKSRAYEFYTRYSPDEMLDYADRVINSRTSQVGVVSGDNSPYPPGGEHQPLGNYYRFRDLESTPLLPPGIHEVELPEIVQPWQGIATARPDLEFWWTEFGIWALRDVGGFTRIFGEDPLEFRSIRGFEGRAHQFKWDGENVWVATRGKGIQLVSLQGKQVAQFTTANGLPPYDLIQSHAALESNKFDQSLRIHPIEPGRCLAIGMFCRENDHSQRRCWVAVLSAKPNEPAVRIVHEAKNGIADVQAKDDINVAFVPQWVASWQSKDQHPQLLVARTPLLGQKSRRPWLIDLQTLEISLMPGRIYGKKDPGVYIYRPNYDAGDYLHCHDGKLLVHTENGVEFWKPPADPEAAWIRQSLSGEEIAGVPLGYDGIARYGEVFLSANSMSAWTFDLRTLQTTTYQDRRNVYAFIGTVGISPRYGLVTSKWYDRGLDPPKCKTSQLKLTPRYSAEERLPGILPRVPTEKYERHFAALKKLEELGAVVAPGDDRPHSPQELWIKFGPLWKGTADDYQLLGDVHQLRGLWFYKIKLDNATLESIVKQHPEITNLALVYTEVNDDGVPCLLQLSGLHTLHLEGPAGAKPFTDRTWHEVKKINSLRILTLAGRGFTGAIAEDLKQQKRIRTLELFETNLGRKDLAILKEASRIRTQAYDQAQPVPPQSPRESP